MNQANVSAPTADREQAKALGAMPNIFFLSNRFVRRPRDNDAEINEVRRSRTAFCAV